MDPVSISLFALATSICSFLWTIRQSKDDSTIAYLTQLAPIEAEISRTPSVLRFHNIELAELKKYDVTPEEFSYLVASFTLGGAWYEAFGHNDITPYKVGEYRYTMCKAPATKRVWPLLARMMEDSPYKKKVAATIDAT